MNKPVMPDFQNSQDTRKIDIQRVGIKDIRHPVAISDRAGTVQHSVANFCMYVGLPHHFKGTHMSRFVEILNNHEYEITVESFKEMISETLERLEAESTYIEMTFPFFVNKQAPVSGVKSLMDYEVTFIGEAKDNKPSVSIKVVIPVTSLCPCSKGISEYGAHNQRTHVTLTCEVSKFVWVEELIDIVERCSSSELYGILKRPDEKFVTERAYDNPRFVEDLVRDIAVELNQDEQRITGYILEAENFESIHNHSAYAMVVKSQQCSTL